jgi:hypothetical protein
MRTNRGLLQRSKAGSARHPQPPLLVAGGFLLALAACSARGVAAPPTSTSVAASEQPTDTLPSDKQAELDRIAQQLASAQAQYSGVPKSGDSGSPKPEDSAGQTILEPHYDAGAGTVIETSDPPPGSDAVISNRWFERRAGGTFIVVYAGRDGTVTTDGLVLLYDGSPQVQRIDAPVGHGALHIVGATGEVLDLQAADGATLKFDAASRSFK